MSEVLGLHKVDFRDGLDRRERRILFAGVLRSVIIFAGLWHLVTGDVFWAIGSFFLAFLSMIPTLLERNLRMTLPWPYDSVVTASLFIHAAGGDFGWYTAIPYYDVVAHFVSALAVAFIAASVMYILNFHTDFGALDAKINVFLVVMFAMALGVVWEFIEWGADGLFNLGLQWSLNDTMKDLLTDMIGGLFAALMFVPYLHRLPEEERAALLHLLTRIRDHQRRAIGHRTRVRLPRPARQKPSAPK